MAVRIGEMLLKAGLITAAQLDEALKNQVIFGGRLGTNLIEIGAVKEEDLARVLGEKLGVPYAPPQMLNSVPAEVIRLLPKSIAQQYRVIPFHLEKNRLSLVMADPSDLSAVDEIAFITGFIVRPFVASEVRIALALERYYQVRRDMRYIKITEQMARPAASPAQAAPRPAPAAPRPAVPAPPQVRQPPPQEELELADDLVELMELDLQAYEPPPAPVPAAKPEPPKAEPRIEVPKPAPKTPAAPPRYTPETVSEDLAEATDREVVADVMIAYAADKVRRCAIFLIRGNSAAGWRAVVNGGVVAAEAFQAPLDEPSVLKVVAEGKSPYLGQLPDTPVNRTVLEFLSAPQDARVCLIPLVMMGRVVNVLAAVLDSGDPAETVNELQRLVKKAALAFEILIMKNKILMT
ncbi:MAG TPA: hypothetical protein VNX25_10480 [Verrucomicrobiae bacterium]|nr:hypothetical protein [Verrucomicrobiae bacterium]